MQDVRKALAVSIASRAFAAALGLLALPVYVRWLGVEAYGVVGLFATLQVLVAFMDMGLATTLTRELAGVGPSNVDRARGRDLARTFEWFYVALAIAVAALLAWVAPWVARHWLNLERLGSGEVAFALQLAGVALACQWPSNLFSAGLSGLHRQVELSVWSSVFASLRVAIAVGAVAVAPTLESFFLAQIAAGVLQSAGMRHQMWRSLALPGHRPRVDPALMHRVRSFAAGMTAITVTSIVIVQLDKVILSYLLRLSDFGVYVIAGTLASGLYILISPVFSVIYPRLAALWNAHDQPGTAGMYHASSQAMAALVVPLAAVMIAFPAASLFVLTGDADLSRRGAWMLVFLAAGTAFNGLMNIPYALQLAAGWTSLSVKVNLVAIAWLAPAMWFAAARWGAAGGAASWALMNAGALVVTPLLLHRRLLPSERNAWFMRDVVFPMAASAAAVALLSSVQPALESRWLVAFQLGGFWVLALAAAVLSMVSLRQHIAALVWRQGNA